MADYINTLLDRLETVMAAAIKAETIKDGNIPLKNAWRGFDFEPNPRQLPAVQFDAEDAPQSATYVTAPEISFPFSVRFIVWVNGKGGRGDTIRARDIREALRICLHDQRPFETIGAAHETLRYVTEIEPYQMPYAVGMGLIVTGDLLRNAT